MFSRAPNVSKICLLALVEQLKVRGYVLHDVQFLTPHLRSLGAREIPRAIYEQCLREALQCPHTWQD